MNCSFFTGYGEIENGNRLTSETPPDGGNLLLCDVCLRFPDDSQVDNGGDDGDDAVTDTEKQEESVW